LDGVGDGHVVGMPDEVREHLRAGVDAVDCLSVLVVQQAQIGPEEVTRQ
jgi:hypothetical protein